MTRTAPTRKRRRGWAWTLTIIAALLAVVWVGSMRWFVSVVWPQYQLATNSGGIVIFREDTARHYVGFATDCSDNGDWDLDWWFEYDRMSVNGQPAISIWFMPLWPFVLLTGVPGVWMLVKTRKHTNPHACPACGYDRTGLPQTSTGPAPCPECGKGKDDDEVRRAGESAVSASVPTSEGR